MSEWELAWLAATAFVIFGFAARFQYRASSNGKAG